MYSLKSYSLFFKHIQLLLFVKMAGYELGAVLS